MKINKMFAVSNFRFHFFYLFVFVLHLLTKNQKTLCTPSIYPAKEFNVQEDVKKIQHLRRSEPNYVPDDTTIANIICHRSKEQRVKIKEEFAKLPDLLHKDVECYITTGNEISYDQLLNDCFKTEMEIYLNDLHRELETRWEKLTKETVIEIILSIPPLEKKKFRDMYATTYGPIEDAIDANIHGDFKNIVLEMIARERQQEIPIDVERAKKEAQKLIDEIDKWDDCRQELDRILIETPLQQLNATLTEFRNIHGKELDQVIDHKMKKDKSKMGAYKSMIFYSKNRFDYYARQLEHSMSGWGTEDHTLNRIISIQCEKDLTEIAIAFKLNTADDLIQRIESDTMNHQTQLLTCLAGKQDAKESC